LYDEKLKLVAAEDRWYFIALLCCKSQGILDKQDGLLKRKVAVKLGVQVETLDEIARRLSEIGVIDRQTLQPVRWEARQFKADGDSTAAERKRRQREREAAAREANQQQVPANDEKLPPEHVTRDVTGDVTRDATNVTSLEEESEAETDTEADTEEEAKKVIQAEAGAQTPNVASPAERSIEIAVYLRQRGIVGANSANPNISAWGDDVRVTNEILDAALSIIAARRMERMPGPNYLAPIIEDLLNQQTAVAKPSGSVSNRDASRAAAAASIGLGAPSYDHASTDIDAEFRRIA
jgi:hypothetical protein